MCGYNRNEAEEDFLNNNSEMVLSYLMNEMEWKSTGAMRQITNMTVLLMIIKVWILHDFNFGEEARSFDENQNEWISV